MKRRPDVIDAEFEVVHPPPAPPAWSGLGIPPDWGGWGWFPRALFLAVYVPGMIGVLVGGHFLWVWLTDLLR